MTIGCIIPDSLDEYKIRYRELLIPIGCSNALRPVCMSNERHHIQGFQSLLGFLMRCDMSPTRPRKFKVLVVSIPIGFSNALRHECWRNTAPRFNVSIPIGFSNALRHRWAFLLLVDALWGFNPYWVF